jgi:DNA-binding HxlR family transcriptional regulator
MSALETIRIDALDPRVSVVLVHLARHLTLGSARPWRLRRRGRLNGMRLRDYPPLSPFVPAHLSRRSPGPPETMRDSMTSPATPAYPADNCTVGRTIAILGERSTLLVVREALTGVRRFEDMRVRTEIPRQMLADRLRMLVEHGILRKEPYRAPGQRVRHEYRPTDKGLALYPVLVAIAQWGDRYLADPEGPPMQFEHRSCGAKVDVSLCCAHGHAVSNPRDVAAEPGPGARLR